MSFIWFHFDTKWHMFFKAKNTIKKLDSNLKFLVKLWKITNNCTRSHLVSSLKIKMTADSYTKFFNCVVFNCVNTVGCNIYIFVSYFFSPPGTIMRSARKKWVIKRQCMLVLHCILLICTLSTWKLERFMLISTCISKVSYRSNS